MPCSSNGLQLYCSPSHHSIILIFTDNPSLSNAINDNLLSNPIILYIWRKLQSFKSNYDIGISWFKAHTVSIGNNTADSLAKSAASSSTSKFLYGSSIPSAILSLKSSISNEVRTNYELSKHKKRLLLFFPINFPKLFNWLDFDDPVTIIILTGHGGLNAHQSKIDPDISPDCRFCEEAPETIDHLIFTCPAWSLKRSQMSMLLQKFSNIYPTHLHHFSESQHSWSLLVNFIKNMF